MSIITHEDLPRIRRGYRNQVIVFCSGSFDLTHVGHVLFFEACRQMGDQLVVGVGPDIEIKKNKGSDRPIQSEQVRLKMVDSLKPVDFSFLTRPTTPGDSFLSPLEPVFRLLRPDFWVVNYDAQDPEERYKLARAHGVILEVLKMDRECPEYDGISTSGLIRKIQSMKPD